MNFNAGDYRFNITVDDGARFYLDGALLIDEWRDGSERTVTVERTLTAGNHFFQVEYYDRSANARIRFWWESAESRLPGLGEMVLSRPRPLVVLQPSL